MGLSEGVPSSNSEMDLEWSLLLLPRICGKDKEAKHSVWGGLYRKKWREETIHSETEAAEIPDAVLFSTTQPLQGIPHMTLLGFSW